MISLPVFFKRMRGFTLQKAWISSKLTNSAGSGCPRSSKAFISGCIILAKGFISADFRAGISATISAFGLSRPAFLSFTCFASFACSRVGFNNQYVKIDVATRQSSVTTANMRFALNRLLDATFGLFASAEAALASLVLPMSVDGDRIALGV